MKRASSALFSWPGLARRQSRASARLCYSDPSFNPRTDCCPERGMNHCLRKAMNPILLAAIVLAMALSPPTPVAAQQADRKSTRLNSSHIQKSRMPSSA